MNMYIAALNKIFSVLDQIYHDSFILDNKKCCMTIADQ